MDLRGKKVLVVGSGISGIGAAELLENVGALPILYDGNEKLKKENIQAKLGADSKTEIVLGQLTEEVKAAAELVVLSPGVPAELPFVQELKARGIALWGEVELAYQFSKGQVVAITGTNGKTTTTALTGELMKSYFDSVFVVGNIGTPYTGEALSMNEDSVTVAEISSFQLETVQDFHPTVSAILNVTPDHLDRHHTMECYAATKERVAENQTEADVCVLNYDDAYTRAFAEQTRAEVLFFSGTHRLDKGVYLEDDTFIYNDGETITRVCRTDEIKLLGMHNFENVMAAIAIAFSMKLPLECIRKTLMEFQAVEHRIEYVTEHEGVVYYNDSKGTNTDAAIKGIQAMNRPTLLIGGGYDKGSEYDDWIESFDGKVRYLVLLGATAEKIAETARRHGFQDILFAESLQEAVEICAEKANAGDAVLLSPACASWGMFTNYEERGRLFKEYVRALK